MTKDGALDLALEALEKSVATCFDRYAHEQVMSRPEHFINQAITAIKQARALDKKAENARELGLDYEPADGTQVSKVWWDGEKLMAKPIPLEDIYQPVQDSTCNETLRAQDKAYPRTCKKCGKGPCIGAPKQPPAAQPAPVQDLPFGVGGGLVAIKTLLSRDPCVHANTAIEMIDAILKEHPAAQPAPVQPVKPSLWEQYHAAQPVQEPVGLIARLKNPEDHYEFTDPKKANAVLMSLCQEAADALAAPVQPAHISPKQLLALAQEANLGLDKVIEVFRMAAQPAPVQEPVALEEYDAGLLNDYGGGNVEWWQDYIRAELGRAYEHYQSQIAAPPAQPAPVQEPVAWISAVTGDLTMQDMSHTVSWAPLYTTPPAAAVQEGRDWSLLEATQESLREHIAEIKRLKEEQRQWVGVTTEEIYACDDASGLPQHEITNADLQAFAYAIEAKLKEKNNG
jgi:hypothetical protein